MFRRSFLAATLAAAAALPAIAHHDGDQYGAGQVVVSHAHTVAVSGTAHAIDVFVTIENTGETPVTLTGAEVDFAAPGVFQAPSVAEDGTMSIREVSQVEIAPGQTITMQPGGLHIVFNDVQQPVEAGAHFHAHLLFADMPEVEVDVEVEDPEALDLEAESVG